MRPCQAVLYMADTTYECDREAPHPGIAHSHNTILGPTYWVSDGEARRHKNNHHPEAAHQ